MTLSDPTPDPNRPGFGNRDVDDPAEQTASQAGQWSEKHIGKSWQFQFFHLLLSTLGKRPAYHIMYLVTFWYVLLYPSVRRRCRHYLDRKFPDRASITARFLDSYKLIRTFGRTLVDMAAGRILGDRAVGAYCPHAELIYQLRDHEQGTIMLNAHVGCWQLGLSALPHMGKPVALTLIPDDKVAASIPLASAYVIDPRQGMGAVMQMTQSLLEGHIVGLMADRVFGDPANSVPVAFLGQTAWFPITPYRLASATGCPVMLLLAPKTSYRDYQLHVRTIFCVPPKLGSNPRSYQPYAQHIAHTLEQFLKEYPWQYFNFYDIWTRPGGEL